MKQTTKAKNQAYQVRDLVKEQAKEQANQATTEFLKAKEQAQVFLKRNLPQVIVQGVIIVAVSVASYSLMTWLVTEIAGVEDTFLAALYEILGTLFLMVIALVSVNTYIYRSRFKEIDTLSEAIFSVANGDFQYRIEYHPRDPMAGVYENFNKMTSELASVQLLQNDFINNYSHEFKTPIASIGGFAELLLEKDLSKEQQQEYLTIIRDESERLSTLASNTIFLSKLSNQQRIGETEVYNLGEQLRQCAIICSGAWMGKHQDFESDLPDVDFEGNKEIMSHLWLNLLTNAVKYTPEGGTITLTLEESPNSVLVCVRDTGEGMSQATQAHLFDPYFQGDSSRSAQGLGLGLSICSRIIELCKGFITVESAVGQGSAFFVTLPKNTSSAK